jgi:effector-binding domain-containing protein
VEKTYDVKEMNFPSTTYALYRQVVKMNEIQKFFALNLQPIFSEIQKSGVTPGVPTGLYYSWDKEKQETDLAAAIPVPAGTTMNEPTITIETINASKALFIDYYGSYDKLSTAYESFDKYLADKNLKQKFPVIEQYITDPQTEPDPSKWQTKIIFLVE